MITLQPGADDRLIEFFSAIPRRYQGEAIKAALRNGGLDAGRVAAEAIATQEATMAVTQIARATQTAVPFDAALASTNARTTMAKEWTGVAALVVGLVLCSLAGFAIVAWLRTQARIVRPTASGQMPMLWNGHTVIRLYRE